MERYVKNTFIMHVAHFGVGFGSFAPLGGLRRSHLRGVPGVNKSLAENAQEEEGAEGDDQDPPPLLEP